MHQARRRKLGTCISCLIDDDSLDPQGCCRHNGCGTSHARLWLRAPAVCSKLQACTDQHHPTYITVATRPRSCSFLFFLSSPFGAFGQFETIQRRLAWPLH